MADSKITSAKEWRRPREEGVVTMLPYSGNTVRIRTVDAEILLRANRIPDPLLGIISRAMAGDDPAPTETERENTVMYLDFLDELARLMFVEPRIAEKGMEPGEDEISIDDVHLQDKVFLNQLINVPGSRLIPFSSVEAPGVGSLSTGADDGDSPVEADEPAQAVAALDE